MKDNSALPKSVGIWIRVSTEDQARGESPEHHEKAARDRAASRGWVVKEVYNLAGQSGKAVMQHSEAKRMMRDIERKHITGLVFSKLARLSRNRSELEKFLEFFNANNADLISLSEAIDTTSADGRMFFGLLGVFAQWEREEIAERVKASVTTRAKLGKSINGSAPFGYQWQNRKLILRPEEAAIRRKAYELFLQCRRKGHVARELNAAGYRTRKKCIWRDTSILRILHESSAKGVYFFNTMRQTGNWRTEPKPESEWGKVECEPIVSEELLEQVNRIIEEQLKKDKRPGKSPVHLFSGLAHCSCGHKMYVSSKSPKYFCRKCRNKVAKKDLEEAIVDDLGKMFGQPDRVNHHLEAAEKNLAEKTALLDAHQQAIQKVRNEMTQTYRLYVEGQITPQGFGDFYKPAEERLNQLLAELPNLEAEVEHLKTHNVSADGVLRESATIQEKWPHMDMGEKRKVIETLIEKIVIGEDDFDVNYSILPSSEEGCKNQLG